MPQRKVGQVVDIHIEHCIGGDQDVIGVERLAGKARLKQRHQRGEGISTQGLDVMQVVVFIVGVVAVLLQKLGLMDLVLGRRHPQPQWQCLLVDHGIGQCDCPAKVGGRRLFDDGVQPVLQGTGAQAHGLQVIHAFHDRVVVAVYSVIQQVLINTLQRALAKCLMGLAQAERQILQQAQAVEWVRQALGDFIAQGVDRGKDFVAQARGPEQRLARALRVDTAALSDHERIGQRLWRIDGVQVQRQAIGIRQKSVKAMACQARQTVGLK